MAAAPTTCRSPGNGSWTVSDDRPVYAGDGCENPGGSTGSVSCAGDAALVVVTGGDGDDDITLDPSIPGSAKARGQRQRRQRPPRRRPRGRRAGSGRELQRADNGSDTLEGNGGNDVLYADPGGDQLNGGDGEDLLVSSVVTCQGHRFDGGAGEDTVSYARSNDNLRITLNGTGGPAGCGNLDQILGDNESLEGSDGPDVITGDNGENSLLGHLGADTFFGRGRRRLHRRRSTASTTNRSSAAAARTKWSRTPPTRLRAAPAVPVRPGAAPVTPGATDRPGAQNPPSPINGTKRQGPIVSASSPRRRGGAATSASRSSSPAAIGTTMRPPSAS